MKRISFVFSAPAIFSLMIAWIAGSGDVWAKSAYLTSFNTKYGTSGTVLNTCGICHVNPNGGGTRTSYGNDFLANGDSFTAALEARDSDGDTYTNLAEITARTFPGDAASKPAGGGTTADITLPIVTAFTVPATSASLTISIASFTATDNVAVTGYLVNESATKPQAGAAGWSATRPTAYVAATTGGKTLYAWAKDAANNVSASRSASVTISTGGGGTTADTTAPTVLSFTVPATSASLTVPISSFSASDNVGVTGYLVNQSSTKPLANATGWTCRGADGLLRRLHRRQNTLCLGQRCQRQCLGQP